MRNLLASNQLRYKKIFINYIFEHFRLSDIKRVTSPSLFI